MAAAFAALLIVVGAGSTVVALPAWGWLLVAAAIVAAASWWTSTGNAMLITAIGWLMVNGFVANGLGELTWHGRADVVRLLTLAAAAMVPQAVRFQGPRPR